MENEYIIRHKEGGYLMRDASNRYVRTPHDYQAKHFTYRKARNVYDNMLNPNLRSNWEIVPVSEGFAYTPAESAELQGPFDWAAASADQQKFFRNLKDYERELDEQYNEVMLEICDIQHYIEFFNLDAARGYKAYRMMKERLQRRRHIKDEMAKTRCFLEGNPEDFSSGHVDRRIRGFGERHYTPRVLCELFDVQAS